MNMKKLGQLLTLILIIGLSFLAGLGTQKWIDKSWVNFPILNQAYSYLVDNAYSPPDNDEIRRQLEYGMINGMFQAFGDPHTRFVPPAVHEVEMDQLEGVFGGIGANIEKNSEGKFLLYPSMDSPAQQAGILDGDILLQVDDWPVSPDSSMDEVISAIRGPVDSKVLLNVLHVSGQSEIVTINREEYAIPSVTYHYPDPSNRIGVIKVSLIAASTPDEIESAIEDLLVQGAETIILDLRDNGGGYVDAGVDIAGMFLPKSEIINKQYHDESKNESLSSFSNGKYQYLPLYIFVNHGTASAAEIITGALQAKNRAKVIGTTTYGKNSIQLVFDLSDGSSVHITNALWYVPGLSYDISKKGIIPDLELPDDQLTIDICIQKILEDMK
jgi:carboxyl-terminal processing protease